MAPLQDMSHAETQYDKHYADAIDVLHRTASTAKAYEFISRIDDEDYRHRTFNRVAVYLVEHGDLNAALEFCGAIAQPLGRADALVDVTQVLIACQNFAAANDVLIETVRSAESVTGQDDRGAVLFQIAEQFDRLGKRSEAIALLRQVIDIARAAPQSFEAAKVLSGCARVFAKRDLLGEAISIAESIESRWYRLRRNVLQELKCE